jgi:hypothetical protein
MNIVMGTWYIFEKRRPFIPSLSSRRWAKQGDTIKKSRLYLYTEFLSPKSQHVYCTTYGQGYITLYPNNQCTVEVL